MARGEDTGVSSEDVLKRKEMKHGSLFSGIGGFEFYYKRLAFVNIKHYLYYG